MLPCVHGCAPASADRRTLRSGPTLQAHSTSSPNWRPFLAEQPFTPAKEICQQCQQTQNTGKVLLSWAPCPLQVLARIARRLVLTHYDYDSSCSWCPLKRGHHQTGGMQHNGPSGCTLCWYATMAIAEQHTKRSGQLGTVSLQVIAQECRAESSPIGTWQNPAVAAAAIEAELSGRPPQPQGAFPLI